MIQRLYILFLIGLILFFTIRAKQSPNTTFSFTAIPFSANDILSPGRHLNTWAALVEWPSSNTLTMTVYPNTVITHGWDAYVRINWAQIEAGGSGSSPATVNRFDMTEIEQSLRWCIDRGMRLSLGILPMCEGYEGYPDAGGFNLSYPTWLHNAMQALAGTANDDYVGNGHWVPNWNSSLYLNAHDTLMGFIAAFIASGTYTPAGGPKAGTLVRYRDVLHRLDIRGYGNFGEWHMSGLGSVPSGGNQGATETTLKALVNQHKNKFPNYKLTMIVNAMARGCSFAWWILNGSGEAQTNKGRYGIRRDNWGQPIFNLDMECNPCSHNPGSGTVTAQSQINEVWKTAPIDGEPSTSQVDVQVPSDPGHIYWDADWCGPCSQGSKNSGYCTFPSIPVYTYGDMPREAVDQHASSWGNGNWATGYNTQSAIDSIMRASKLMGYRLILTGGSMTTTLQQGAAINITVDWRNTGVAPNYEAWDVLYELRTSADAVLQTFTSGFDVRGFLPSASSTTVNENFTVGAGVATGTTHKLVMIIRDSANYRQPLPLAISSPARNSDGSYTLASNITLNAASSGTVTERQKIRSIIIRNE